MGLQTRMKHAKEFLDSPNEHNKAYAIYVKEYQEEIAKQNPTQVSKKGVK